MDSFIINYFLGLTIIGILSNYQLIINSVKSLLGSFNSALSPSLGNFLSEVKDKENIIILFKRINFLFFFLGSMISIGFALLINPFINLWLGQNYLLTIDVVLLISLVFFFDQITTSLWHFMNSSGKFKNESFSSVLASIIKFGFSIILVPFLGISGIFISTILSNLIYFINRLNYLNNEFFKFHGFKYIKNLFAELIFVSLQYFLLFSIISLFEFSSWFNLFVGLVISTIFLLLSNIIFYRNNESFKFYLSMVKKFSSKFKIKN
jgi:O-antigen/teichoic acid export membrane protein